LANTAMGRDLNADEVVKVLCVRSKIGATPAANRSRGDTVAEFSLSE
jgi:hypothetical protein